MKQKNIVITGCSRGIGKALVAMALKHPDLNVIAITRNDKVLKKEFESEERKPHIIPYDLSEQINDYHQLFKEISSHYKSIHYLINNAATLITKPINEFTLSEALNIYQTNVISPFMLIRTMLPLMKNLSDNGAHIVNIGSMGGFQGSVKFPGLSLYASSKAALANLSEVLAEELKPDKISVNCLALGAVRTEMLKTAFPDYNGGVHTEVMAQFILNFTLTGHLVFNGKILPTSNSTP
jgi:short-subunit dehydrogenase